MSIIRSLLLGVALASLLGCSGGGGPTSVVTGAPWEKFRHDPNNTGASGISVPASATPGPHPTWSLAIDAQPTPGAGSASGVKPISSSPAVAIDGTVYVGTEGGTLAAVNPNGTIKWRRVSCETCAPPTAVPGATPEPTPPGGGQLLGPLVSSPAVYTLNSVTSVFIGSLDGKLLVFQDEGTTGACSACFQPSAQPGFQSAFGSAASAQFVSSPTFTTNASTFNISGIFIGASVQIPQGNTTRVAGKLYAINNDGSERWEFPLASDPAIGPVTSSPVLASGTLYITAADTLANSAMTDDGLYAIANDGTLNDGTRKWRAGVGKITDLSEPTAPFVASPLSDTQIFLTNADGEVVAINPNGSRRWGVMLGSTFLASLAIGNPAMLATATPTSTSVATSTPPQAATPTPTPTPPTQHLFGVSKGGVFFAINVGTGEADIVRDLTPSVTGPVISSPALSFESILIFGDNAGMLHALDTSDGTELWSVMLAPGVPVRSSPAIGSDGTIYVGADDGMLYAVNAQ